MPVLKRDLDSNFDYIRTPVEDRNREKIERERLAPSQTHALDLNLIEYIFKKLQIAHTLITSWRKYNKIFLI